MATIASLNVALGANTATLRRDLDRASQLNRNYTNRTRSAYQSLNTSITGLRNGFLAFTAALGVGQVLQSTDDLLKLSQATDIGFESFQRFQFSLAQTGVQAQQLRNGIVRMGRALDELRDGSGESVQAFERLGLAAEDFAGTNNQQQFELIADRLRDVGDAGERAALTAEVFGGRLAAILAPALRATNAELRLLGQSIEPISEEDARRIEQFNDQIADAGRSVARLVTQLSPLFQFLGNLAESLANLGDRFNGVFNVAVGAVAIAVVNRFLPVLTALSTAFSRTEIAARRAAARTAILSAAYGDARTTIGRFTLGVGFAIRRITGLTVGVRTLLPVFTAATFAARGFSLVIGALGGPIGILITGITLLATVSRDSLIVAWRALLNTGIRLVNLIIRFSNLFDGHIDEIELYSLTLDDAADSTDMLADALNGLDLTVDETFTNLAESASTALDTLPMLGEEFEALEGLANQALDGITEGLTDLFTQGETDARAFANSLIREFIRIQVRSAITRSFNIPFGGFRQNGGPVQAGQAYVVGEAGPELFVPSVGGNIVANGESGGGGGGTTIINNISAIDSQSFNTALARDPEFVSNVVARGQRSQGGLRR